MSDYPRFSQTILSLLPVKGFEADFDLEVEQGDSSKSDGLHRLFILYADSALWRKLTMTKDHKLELLRWYIQLKKIDFVVRDKANVHALIDPG